jgi:hypothetical protein
MFKSVLVPCRAFARSRSISQSLLIEMGRILIEQQDECI